MSSQALQLAPPIEYAPSPTGGEEPALLRAREVAFPPSLRTYAFVAAAVALMLLGVDVFDGNVWSTAVGVLELAAFGAIVAAVALRREWPHAWALWVAAAVVIAPSLLYRVAGMADGESAGAGAGSVFIRLLVAASLLRWTVRQAAVTSAALCLAGLALTSLAWLFDAVGTHYVLLALLLNPASGGVAVALIWWRDARFVRSARLHLESGMFHRLARELEGARRFHESHLPPTLTTGPLHLHYHYQPYRQLGGDLLYLFPRSPAPGRPVTLVLLDVAGHGIAAALTVNRVVGEVERLVALHQRLHATDPSPRTLAEGLNRYARHTLANHGLFATAFLAHLDPASLTLTWVNCGHPPALLIRPGTAPAPLEGETLMLGVCDEVELNAHETVEHLTPGDVVVFCTDGATEARAPSGDALLTAGFRRLVESVSAEVPDARHWPDEIARRLAAFRAAPPDDDTLLATITVSPTP